MRKLVAALACRNEGSRLYAKPLQNLDIKKGVTILDHMIDLIRTVSVIDDIVLGVSEGTANLVFLDYAKKKGVKCITGSPKDVLHRLILCGREAGATDIFRVTTESPFFYFEILEEAWKRHVKNGNDETTTDGLPEGANIQIFTLQSLEDSHRLGEDRHRSELCGLYIRENRTKFKVEIPDLPIGLERVDLRLTVDYPEDLILCREVYAHFKDRAPRFPMAEIISFLDNRPDLKALVEPYVVPKKLWS